MAIGILSQIVSEWGLDVRARTIWAVMSAMVVAAATAGGKQSHKEIKKLNEMKDELHTTLEWH